VEKLILQAEWLCHGIRAVAVSELGRPAVPARPRAPNGRGRACGWGARRSAGQLLGLAEEKQAGVEIGRYTK